MMTGWIKLHRKFTDWEWFTDVNTCHVFLYLLLKANHKEKNWKGIVIKRGQLITSLHSLAEAMPLSVQQIRTALAKLESTGEVTGKSTNKNRLLTIVKYEEYQSKEPEVTGQSTDKQQTDNRQITATKEYKKERRKEVVSKEGQKVLPLPEWLPKDDWDAYIEMRDKKGKGKATFRAKQLVIMKIIELRQKGHDPTAVLQQSIINGWTSVFEIKENNNGSYNSKPTADDNCTAGILLALSEPIEEQGY